VRVRRPGFLLLPLVKGPVKVSSDSRPARLRTAPMDLQPLYHSSDMDPAPGAPMYRNRKPRWRAARRQALKAQGITPCLRNWVWNVRPSIAPLPDWVAGAAVKGLGSLEDQVWLWPVDARRLMKWVKAHGGRSWAVRAEFRRCEMCGRPLIGVEAEARRRQIESGPAGRALNCGPECDRDRASRLWVKLAPSVVLRREEAA